MRFSNLDIKSKFQNYLRTLNTCVITCESRQNSKMGKEPRKKCKVRKVKNKK